MVSNKDWWAVKNLEKYEKEVKKLDEITNLEKHGDFGSYRSVLKGVSISEAGLAQHNDLNSKLKIRFIDSILLSGKDSAMDILDAGCGMGFTTHELGKFYSNSKVVGVDISSDGIMYAKDNFRSEDFLCQGIDPKNPPLGRFDLIFCFEFYPFTRTNSVEVHREYLDYFLSQLKETGELILHQRWENPDSISSNMSVLKNQFGLYRFNTYRIPHAKLIKLFKFAVLSKFMDKFFRFLLRKDQMRAIIISKK
jgi:SAM-dependent methyltransferase